MRVSSSLLLVVAVFCAFVVGARAADTGTEVTLKGEIMCAKCELKEATKCQTVIQVKEDGKDVTYYLKDKGKNEEYHEAVCGGGRKEGTVTGIVSKASGKLWITPSKVEYAQQ